MRNRRVGAALPVVALVLPLLVTPAARAAAAPLQFVDAPTEAVRGDVTLSADLDLSYLGDAHLTYATVTTSVVADPRNPASTRSRFQNVGLGSCPTSGTCRFSFSISTEEMPNGPGSVSVLAFDDTSRAQFAGVTLQIANPKPSVVVDAPTSGAQVWPSTTVTATATADPEGAPVRAVRFYGPQGLLAEDTEAPYEVAFGAGLPVQKTAVVAVAVATDGNASPPASVGLLLSPGPTVTLTNPAPVALRPREASSLVQWTMREPDGLDLRFGNQALVSADVLVDGELVDHSPDSWCAWACSTTPVTSASWGIGVDTRAWSPGSHRVTVRVTDRMGAVGEATSLVTVDEGVAFGPLRDAAGRDLPAVPVVVAGSELVVSTDLTVRTPGATLSLAQIMLDDSGVSDQYSCESPTGCATAIRREVHVLAPNAVGRHVLRLFATTASGATSVEEHEITVIPATALTASAAPAAASGATARVTGRLTRTDTSAGLADQPVTVEWRAGGTTSWRVLSEVRTGADGTLAYLAPTTGGGSYRLRFAGVAGAYGPAVSPSRQQPSAITAKYAALGAERSPLGAPVGDEYALGSARGQNYLHGRIYSAAATGVHELHGAIFGRWAALQGPGGVLGLPTTDERTTPDGRGRYNHFVGGSVYWSSSTGAHAVGGAIRSRWAALGWERSRLGYPTSDEYAVSGGRRSDFAHGSLIWSARSGVVTVVYR